MPFQHKIFDLDDTIIQTQIRYEEIKQAAADFIKSVLHTPLSDEDIKNRFTVIDIDNIKEHGFSKERFPLSWKETYESIAREQNENANHAEEVYELAFGIHRQKFDLYPEALESLQSLKKDGVKLSLLTLGEKSIQRKKIDDLNLSDYFHDIYIVEREKFEILNGMGNKEKTSMVGNSLRSDIEPALEAGLHAFHINQSSWSHDHVEIKENYGRLHQLNKIGEVIPYLETLKKRLG